MPLTPDGMLDKVIQLAARLKIASTPTIVLFDGRRIVGTLAPEELVEVIDQLGAVAH
jgi:thiol:disulfide interchange protein DsbC